MNNPLLFIGDCIIWASFSALAIGGGVLIASHGGGLWLVPYIACCAAAGCCIRYLMECA